MRQAKRGTKMQAVEAVFKAYFQKGGKGKEAKLEDVHVCVMCDVGSGVLMHVHICVCM